MKTKEQIIDLMTEFDKTIKIIKEWVEGKPQEPVVPEWVKSLKYNASGSFIKIEYAINIIRTEVISKICEEIKQEFHNSNMANRATTVNEDVDAVKARWLKGE